MLGITHISNHIEIATFFRSFFFRSISYDLNLESSNRAAATLWLTTAATNYGLQTCFKRKTHIQFQIDYDNNNNNTFCQLAINGFNLVSTILRNTLAISLSLSLSLSRNLFGFVLRGCVTLKCCVGLRDFEYLTWQIRLLWETWIWCLLCFITSCLIEHTLYWLPDNDRLLNDQMLILTHLSHLDVTCRGLVPRHIEQWNTRNYLPTYLLPLSLSLSLL